MSLDSSEAYLEQVVVSNLNTEDGHHPFYIESLSSNFSLVDSQFKQMSCVKCNLIEASFSNIDISNSYFEDFNGTFIKVSENCNISVINSEFKNSNKHTGMFLDDSFCEVQNSTFEQLGNNDGQLESFSLGGAIHSGDSELHVEDSVFTNNTATMGGAVYIFLSNEKHFDFET